MNLFEMFELHSVIEITILRLIPTSKFNSNLWILWFCDVNFFFGLTDWWHLAKNTYYTTYVSVIMSYIIVMDRLDVPEIEFSGYVPGGIIPKVRLRGKFYKRLFFLLMTRLTCYTFFQADSGYTWYIIKK